MGTITIKESGGRVYAYTPYSGDFVARAKNAGGKWDASSKAWSFPAGSIQAVRDLCVSVFGEDDQTVTEKVTVRATALCNVWESRGDVCLFGRTISRATGRDSGGRSGDGVFFIKGSPKSGGSLKNWESVVPEGSVIELYDVSISLAKQEQDSCWDIKIMLNDNPDMTALKAERDQLMARVLEIDMLLEVGGLGEA